MADTKYTYSVSTDFSNGVNEDRLEKEIIDAAEIIHKLTSLGVDVNGDVCDIWFTDALGTDGQDHLNDVIIENHSGEPLPSTTPLIKIKQEQVATGGHPAFLSFNIDIDATTGWKEKVISWPIPINMLRGKFVTKAENEGDEVQFLMGEDTTVGIITQDVAVDDTVINVSQTAFDNIDIGFYVSLYDGENENDMGRVLSKDAVNLTLTMETAATNVFEAVTPTLVIMTVKMVPLLRLVGDNIYYHLEGAIGGSYITPGITFTARYNNISGTEKTFSFVVTYLY